MFATNVSGAMVAIGFCTFLTVPVRAQTTTRVSIDSLGGSHTGSRPAISADGRYVAFHSDSALVPDDTNGWTDVFVHDRWTGHVERVSVSSTGEQANERSRDAGISGDGRWVVFSSLASNLVRGDLNYQDVFLHDRQTGETKLVSVSSTGVQADHNCHSPTISADGSRIAFVSFAKNLVPGDTNDAWDVFVRDLAAGWTVRANVTSAGAQSYGYIQSRPFLSANGSRVVFTSDAPDLVPGDNNGTYDVFLRDFSAGTTERVSVDSSGSEGNGSSRDPSIASDGGIVAFGSWATNLVPGDGNGCGDVFVRDLATGTTTRVSLSSAGAQADDSSQDPSISGDGRWVAFDSWASNFWPGVPFFWPHVYVHDRTTGSTTLESQSTAGEPGDESDDFPAISADGRHVAFDSRSSNLTFGSWGHYDSVYVRDRLGCTSTVATYCTASPTSIPGCTAAVTASGTPSLSAPGGFVVSSGLVPGGTVGLAYYGLKGSIEMPFGYPGNYLCAALPRRTAVKASGGSAGSCNGQYTFTLQELVAVEPGLVPGQHVAVGFWFRDPASAATYGMSNAVWFFLCP